MDAKATSAIGAYTQALKHAPGAPADAGKAGGFGDMLSGLMNQAREGTATAEVTEMKALTKEADLVDVVTAISNAEMTVQTVVAVRDRVIQAYNDIIKMPI